MEKHMNQYDGFLLDQFGVLHDGVTVYANALDAVKKLRDAGKKVIILSNSSKRKNYVKDRMVALGFPSDAFLDFVTSGEEAWNHLNTNCKGKKILITSWNDKSTEEFLQELDFIPVSDVHEAELLLSHGTDYIMGSNLERLHDLPSNLEESSILENILEVAAARGLPLICPNADHYACIAGVKKVCPGWIAARYAQKGGNSVMFGKPLASVYEYCKNVLKIEDTSRIVAVGDSMEHDIQGAVKAGIDSIFVAGGVHAVELEIGDGCVPSCIQPSAQNMRKLEEKYGFAPTHVIPRMEW